MFANYTSATTQLHIWYTDQDATMHGEPMKLMCPRPGQLHMKCLLILLDPALIWVLDTAAHRDVLHTDAGAAV